MHSATAQTGVDLQSRVAEPQLQFRELGGAMSSMWASYAPDAHRTLVRRPPSRFRSSPCTARPLQVVVDAASLASVGEGVGLALQMAAGGSCVALLANKQDAPHALPATHVQQLLGMAQGDIHVMQSSALAADGLAAVLQWLAAASPAAPAADAL